MPITQALLTSGGTASNATVYSTASITPTADRLILAGVTSRGGGVTTVSMAGNGLNWVEVATAAFTGGRRVTFLRAMSSAVVAGTALLTFGGGQDNAEWIISEFSGIDTTGTDGSGAVFQVNSGVTASAATSLTITLNAFESSNNGAASVFGIGDNVGVTEDTGWTEVAEVQIDDGASSVTCETQWRADNDTTASATTVADENIAGIAIEIKAEVTTTVAYDESSAQVMVA